MNARLFIPSSLVLCAGIITGCGGSSQEQEYSLPIGLQRSVKIDGLTTDNPDQTFTYVFGFNIISANHAAIYYSGTMGAPNPANGASVHVVKYVPSEDRAESISFTWDVAYVILHNVSNVTKGEGTATCDVRDTNMLIDPAQTGRQGTITTFTAPQ